MDSDGTCAHVGSQHPTRAPAPSITVQVHVQSITEATDADAADATSAADVEEVQEENYDNPTLEILAENSDQILAEMKELVQKSFSKETLSQVDVMTASAEKFQACLKKYETTKKEIRQEKVYVFTPSEKKEAKKLLTRVRRESKLVVKPLERRMNELMVVQSGSSATIFYHASSKLNCTSILTMNSFSMPTKQQGVERGLKMGAAVYFSTSAAYCMEEATATMRESGGEGVEGGESGKGVESGKGGKDGELGLGWVDSHGQHHEESVAIDVLEVTIDLSHALDLRWMNYQDGEEGKLAWPIQNQNQIEGEEDELCVLPNGVTMKKNQKLTRLEWEKNTEAIDMEYLAQFKCDVLLFSVGNDSVTEVAVYNADRIGSIQRKTDRRTAEELFMEELQRNKDQDNLCQMIDSRINAALQDSELEFLDEPMARMPRQENGRYATAPKRRCVMQ